MVTSRLVGVVGRGVFSQLVGWMFDGFIEALRHLCLWLLRLLELLRLLLAKSVSQSISQSVSQSVSQSTSQSTRQSVCQSFKSGHRRNVNPLGTIIWVLGNKMRRQSAHRIASRQPL